MVKPEPSKSGDGLVVRNKVSATSVGGVVQAGVVHGGLHVHPAPEPVVPRQLPAAPGLFAGRVDQLADLDRVSAISSTGSSAGPSREGSDPGSTSEGAPGGTMLISAIRGAGGIGKTWLALHWAHRRLSRFPDGQLFVDLRGFSPDSEPMPSAVAVRGFLDALGVDPGRIPVDPQAQAGLFRSLVAQKRMLIVLDNAANVEQVVPLLPGADSCTVVVTSRRTLTGLITRHGAHHLTLDTLSGDEARALLARRLGAARVAAEPEAVDELVGLCGGFPLALGIIAGRAHTHPRVPLAEFAAELRDLGLGALEDDEPTTSLPAVLSWSYSALTTEQQVVFELLGIAPGPDIGLPAAASLTGLPPTQTGKVLRSLEEASLLSRDAHGRYSAHDLIRAFATEEANCVAPGEKRSATRRVVDHYLHSAHAAALIIDPVLRPMALAHPFPEVAPECPLDYKEAIAWLKVEQRVLLATIKLADNAGLHTEVWRLAWTLETFLERQGHWQDWADTQHAALAAGCQMADRSMQARAHRVLAHALFRLNRIGEAHTHLRQALELFDETDDLAEVGHTHHQLSWIAETAGAILRRPRARAKIRRPVPCS